MNPPPIDPYAAKRKWMAWLLLAGVLGWQLLALLVVVVGKAMFPTASKDAVMAVAFAISIVFAFGCMFISLKFEQEHPIEKKRTSPLDSSQTALAPTDARLQERNNHDATKLTFIVVAMIPCGYVLSHQLSVPSPNIWAIGVVYVLLMAQLILVSGILRRIARYPLRCELAADAEGLACVLEKMPAKALRVA